MDLSLFEYHLPLELIAQEPAEPRDASRLLVVDRSRSSWQDRRFGGLPALLGPGDCLVANQSKVIPARLLGTREADGRPLELLMLRPLAVTRWEALVRPGRRCRVGARVLVAAGAARSRAMRPPSLMTARGTRPSTRATKAPSPLRPPAFTSPLS